jgi:asparagine synthase (glutamine-hydrolysing)
MCGICGEVRFDGGRVEADVVRRMRETLVHRGPDSEGLYLSTAAGLGFRRLRIIDLTPNADQPLPNEDGSIRIVFNGEIYNYRELRRGLEPRHSFRSQSDTEVIVHLYEEMGADAIAELDGMFALAIWDERNCRLLLARDRTGKKPLFYTQTARHLVFASEIKSLLAHPEVAAEIDTESIPYFFMYGYPAGPRTMYSGIQEVPPATVVTIAHSGSVVSHRYWNAGMTVGRDRSLQTVDRREAAATVRRLLTDAVSKRLVSDVPLGAFLSGGVDSTVIVGLMSALMGEPVKTFSIGFEGETAYDETSYARLAAERFQTDHTEFHVTPSAVELLDRLIWHHDGPFGDASAIPTYIVSELTRRQVTVVLNGDGGDELFAGYLRFRAGVLSERIPRPAALALKAIVERLPSPASERHWLSYARRFAHALNLPLYERLTRWNSVFFEDLDQLLVPELLNPPINPLKYLEGELERLQEMPTTLAKLLHANFTTYLPGDLSVKMDRCTMANSLEARSPFLDTALIEYVTALPDDLKLDGKRTKVILREACADLLPVAIQTRAKMGFGVPLGAWFRGALREYLCDHLLDSRARYRAYLVPRTVHRIVERHLAGQIDGGQQLWSILCFERWLRLLPEWTANGAPVHRADGVLEADPSLP